MVFQAKFIVNRGEFTSNSSQNCETRNYQCDIHPVLSLKEILVRLLGNLFDFCMYLISAEHFIKYYRNIFYFTFFK